MITTPSVMFKPLTGYRTAIYTTLYIQLAGYILNFQVPYQRTHIYIFTTTLITCWILLSRDLLLCRLCNACMESVWPRETIPIQRTHHNITHAL